MNDLLNWIISQGWGADAYGEFRARAARLRTVEPDNAAALRILADLAGRFADAYAGEPLSIDIAAKVRAQLLDILEAAIENSSASAPERLAFLNEISKIDALDGAESIALPRRHSV
ncbi:hypothetical protein [Terrarubrum flagellatum]|uniref:hypothetical protein n=1 Tax=Terrirubrum flagellatum TaxID=2895980 RepID=UPI003144F94E